MEKTFDDFTTFDILKHIILNVGQDLNGNFHPYHVDFYICCGLVHTKKGCLFVASTMAFILFTDIITFACLKVYNASGLFGFTFVIELILIWGIKRENRYLMLPHLIISTICIFISIVLMILIIFAITHTNSTLFKLIMGMFWYSDAGVQLACLLFVLVLALTDLMMLWVNWIMYIHYCYLRSMKTCKKIITSRDQIDMKAEDQPVETDVLEIV